GTFYMFFSARTSTTKRGTGIAVATHPLGPFTNLMDAPVTPPDWHCLDGHLFMDVDGSEYLVFAREWVELDHGEMWVQGINGNYTQLVGERHLLFKGTDASWSNVVVDGPAMIHRDGKYFLFWSSFSDGYCCGHASSDAITGPYQQSGQPVIASDGGHVTFFTDHSSGDLLVTFHRPNSGGRERAHVEKIVFRDGTWLVNAGIAIPPMGLLVPVAMVIAIACVAWFRRETMERQ
ncbi:family 43 glycosylhydrolase, partial [Candidatus Bathyarchaeota archaeon]|nr:family 43 glycosylhydrolase [Candidatus Bathyarchaeota archaeon]